MSLLKRLGFYLTGLAIGLIFLAFFLNRKKAQFCYLPNCRVLKELRSKPLSYSEILSRQLSERKLDSTAVIGFLTNGDIDFGASDTKAKPCKTYVIENEIEGQDAVLMLQNCDSLVVATQLRWRP
ncbi:MAG: DUF4258 domain-containing protein [Flavobacteriaceae bacterium]